MDFWNRLISFKEPKESENAFADRIGVPHETLRSWRKGFSPKWETLDEPAANLGTTLLWLLKGIGPKSLTEFNVYMREFTDGLRTGRNAPLPTEGEKRPHSPENYIDLGL